MWNRQRLKCNARVLLKANYLKVVVVGLILSFLIRIRLQFSKRSSKE